jgi:hypothetical protein
MMIGGILLFFIFQFLVSYDKYKVSQTQMIQIRVIINYYPNFMALLKSFCIIIDSCYCYINFVIW